MRPIKFRAYDTIQNRMIRRAEDISSGGEEKELGMNIDGEILELDYEQYYPNIGSVFPRDRYVLMQYTGLLDKEGKEIYEGDIISDGWKEGIVKFGEHTFEVDSQYHSATANGWHRRGFPLDKEEAKLLEVIGNIYENPELLEEKKGE